MNNETYNGYSNKETWLVRLWLDNDEISHAYVMEGIMFSFRTDFQAATLAQYLRHMVLSANPETDASLYCDLIKSALSRINFGELADSYLNDYRKELIGWKKTILKKSQALLCSVFLAFCAIGSCLQCNP